MADKEGVIKVINEEEGRVVLEEYDGERKEFEVITVLEVEGAEYLILMEEEEETGEGYALKAGKGEKGETIYEPVVDEEELVKVQQALEEFYEEE